MSHAIPSRPRVDDDTHSLAPLVYTIVIDQPESQRVDITIEVPTEGRTQIELLMARWSPGFYRSEPYAQQVQELVAYTQDGTALVHVSYRLACTSATVTTNWVGAEFAVLNGPATFITLVEEQRRPHELRFVLPAGWSQSFTGLAPSPNGQPHHYRADDFDTLVDAPIVLGDPDVYRFDVAGHQHELVAIGDRAHWDGQQAAYDLQRIVSENSRFWNGLPYDRYVFLIVFREGGGGLEHSNSTLVTARPSRMSTAEGYDAWVTLVAHEFFHLWNVKRLRPIELGPFDYEQQPRTTSLWIAEGLTCYYTDLLLCRAGLRTPALVLAALSAKINELQHAPGRMVQTLEQSSWDVWNNSFSGLNPTETTVSYYTKGHIVGFLLDAHIRRITNAVRSLDDMMRLAYIRYGGEHGFTAAQFRQTAEEVAGVDLGAWLEHAIASTDELDYSEALQWYGLRFAPTDGDQQAAWQLDIDNQATPEAHQHRQQWLS